MQSLSLGLILVLSGVCCYAFEGCTIRFGRRGCHQRTLVGVIVTCDGLGNEKQFPHNLPQDTVYMSLVNFRFGRLTREDFLPFTTIECLTIQDSGVSGIDYDAFADMNDLHEIVLDKTHLHNGDLSFIAHPNFKAEVLAITDTRALHIVDTNATNTLHQIKTIDFSGNRLHSISPKFFPELRHIEELDLSSNRLKSLEWQYLDEMQNLNKLFLAANKIQTIPDYMYGVFFAVKELTLGNNPLHCNCKLKWLRDFYTFATDKTLDVSKVVCASPSSFSILAATNDDFACHHPSPPKISFIEMADGRFEVNCSSFADPAPNLKFTFPDGREILTPPSDDLSKLNTTTPQMISTMGQVKCTATNSEGETSATEDLYPPGYGLNSSSNLKPPSALYITCLVAMATLCHYLIWSVRS